MEKKDFKKEILGTIESKNIEPKPKWQFLLKDSAIWTAGFLAVVIGAVFVSIVIFALFNSEWEVYRLVNQSFLEFIPFVWLVVFAIFVFVADYNFSHTKKGYKYGLAKIILGSIVASVLLGFIFYYAGLAHRADRILDMRIPKYMGVEKRKELLLNHPDMGMLAGSIVPSESSSYWLFKDFEGKTWKVVPNNLSQMDFKVLDNEEFVNLIGQQTGEDTFEVCAIRPWQLKGIKPMPDKPLMRDERNILDLRNNMCGGTASTGPNIIK